MVSSSLGQTPDYICSDAGVYEFTPEDCQISMVTNYGGLTDIAVTPSGDLYGIDFYNFYKVDVLMGWVLFVSEIDSFGSGFNSLVALDDETLLGIRVTGQLYKISTLNGDTSLVGDLMYGPGGDLTYYKGYYYFADAMNQLIRFQYNQELNIVENLSVVGTMNTPNSSVYGVYTKGSIDCINDSLSMLAFEFNMAYLVNPENAQCTLLCENFIPGTVTGATSAVETQNQLLEGTILFPNVYTPNHDAVNDLFIPIGKTDFISEFQFSIINRWGNIIKAATTGDMIEWDGRDQSGEPCNEGLYFYSLEYKDFCSNENKITGFVHLVK